MVFVPLLVAERKETKGTKRSFVEDCENPSQPVKTIPCNWPANVAPIPPSFRGQISGDSGRDKSIRLSNFKTKSRCVRVGDEKRERERERERKRKSLVPGGLTNRPGHGDKSFKRVLSLSSCRGVATRTEREREGERERRRNPAPLSSWSLAAGRNDTFTRG